MNPTRLPFRRFAGRCAYFGYYVPLGGLQRFFRDGGPLVQSRTRAGAREMEAAAWQLTPLQPLQKSAPLTVHLLTGRGFWHQTAFCLQSLSKTSGRAIAPVLFDDGTLDTSLASRLLELFPLGRIVSQQQAVATLDRHLPSNRFPVLRERWAAYPNIRKLIDPHLGSTGWKLVLDSDLLFFREPRFLLNWLASPAQPLHAVDVQQSYGYSDGLLASLAPAPLSPRVNVGLCGLASEELRWEEIENLCATLIAREGTHYYLEQALVALLLAGRACSVAPETDYVTLPRPPEALNCRAVMHHYVAGSKRWYFQRNWRRLAS